MKSSIDIEKVYLHWIESSENDYGTMTRLFETKDFHWSLFVGHIVLEKLLKACVVKYEGKHAPFTHDLSKLASKSGFDFSEKQLDWLDTITTFNLNARYDSHK